MSESHMVTLASVARRVNRAPQSCCAGLTPANFRASSAERAEVSVRKRRRDLARSRAFRPMRRCPTIAAPLSMPEAAPGAPVFAT